MLFVILGSTKHASRSRTRSIDTLSSLVPEGVRGDALLSDGRLLAVLVLEGHSDAES